MKVLYSRIASAPGPDADCCCMGMRFRLVAVRKKASITSLLEMPLGDIWMFCGHKSGLKPSSSLHSIRNAWLRFGSHYKEEAQTAQKAWK